MSYPNNDLFRVMLEAYHPCKHFGHCPEARWDPSVGQIPRGFLGATGALHEVEVVMVFAEPGHPHFDENYDPNQTADSLLGSAITNSYKCFSEGTDFFHRNARWFMSELYPSLKFDEQLRHIWLTEGRLCSIDDEIGSYKGKTCAEFYLARQLGLLPNATVVAFGGKAQRYLRWLGIDHLNAYALAPPGANHRPARPSWEMVIEAIRTKR